MAPASEACVQLSNELGPVSSLLRKKEVISPSRRAQGQRAVGWYVPGAIMCPCIVVHGRSEGRKETRVVQCDMYLFEVDAEGQRKQYVAVSSRSKGRTNRPKTTFFESYH